MNKRIQVKIEGRPAGWEDITFFESDGGQLDLHDPRQKKRILDIRLIDESRGQSEYDRRLEKSAREHGGEWMSAWKSEPKRENLEQPDYMEYNIIWEEIGIEDKLERLKDTLQEIINYINKK